MKVFRLAKKQYCEDLSGKGAELAGGRWNSKGLAMVYTSESRALCLAEIAVHLPVGIVPKDYFLVEIEIPGNASISEIKEAELLPGWDSFPHSQATQEKGDAFLHEKAALVLKVPSAVVKGDFNFLINPLHPGFAQVKITLCEAFSFDKRLFRLE